MSWLGAAMIVAGGAAAAWGVASTERRRPIDLIAALAAPAGVIVALTGGVLVFVPNFFG